MTSWFPLTAILCLCGCSPMKALKSSNTSSSPHILMSPGIRALRVRLPYHSGRVHRLQARWCLCVVCVCPRYTQTWLLLLSLEAGFLTFVALLGLGSLLAAKLLGCAPGNEKDRKVWGRRAWYRNQPGWTYVGHTRDILKRVTEKKEPVHLLSCPEI